MSETACGFVSVIGAPNAGKSTLINALVGSKVSIVSPKVQTTRSRVLGITVHGNAQIIFIDTPGLFSPGENKPMEKAIVNAAWQGMEDGDLKLLVVDVSRKNPLAAVAPILERLAPPCTLVLNKVDLVDKPALLALSQDANAAFEFDATFMVSALNGEGMKAILDHLAKALPPGPFHYPEDQISTMPMRLMAAEITREKLFQKLHKEIPYALTVETESWEDFEDGSIKIGQTIFVTRDAHKKIVLGKGGTMIGSVGKDARHELEDMLETRVHLKLFVKVRENWMDDPAHYRLWGLEK